MTAAMIKVLRAALLLVGVLAALLALAFIWLAIGVHLAGLWQRIAQGAVVLHAALGVVGNLASERSIPLGVAACVRA
jgi:hypothetical protein